MRPAACALWMFREYLIMSMAVIVTENQLLVEFVTTKETIDIQMHVTKHPQNTCMSFEQFWWNIQQKHALKFMKWGPYKIW